MGGNGEDGTNEVGGIVKHSAEWYLVNYLIQNPIDFGDPPIAFMGDAKGIIVVTPDGEERYRLYIDGDKISLMSEAYARRTEELHKANNRIMGLVGDLDLANYNLKEADKRIQALYEQIRASGQSTDQINYTLGKGVTAQFVLPQSVYDQFDIDEVEELREAVLVAYRTKLRTLIDKHRPD